MKSNKNDERKQKQKSINTSKRYISFFAYKQTRNIDITWQGNKS